MSVESLIDYLCAEVGRPSPTDLDPRQKVEALHALLTAREPGAMPPAVVEQVNEYYTARALARPRVSVGTLPPFTESGLLSRVRLWQGDITTLAADAVVNAANERMLGCFVPGHACVDHAIHKEAGPWLRAECAELKADGAPERVGTAAITSGHFLPARFVIHTVGPTVQDGAPTAEHYAQLESSYRSVLSAARQVGAVTVAVPGISTGLAGFPVEFAAPAAINAVLNWMSENPDSEIEVIFTTVTDFDTAIYREELTRISRFG